MTTRRDLLKLGALAPMLPSLAFARDARPVGKASKSLDILILGGTGFTGPFQVNYALARGHKVTLFNRGKRPSPEWPGHVEQLFGDRNTGDLDALKGRRWDVCIDNPTTLPFWVRDAGKVLAGKVAHYLFISTISVYADGSKRGIDEGDALAVYQGKDAMGETQASLRADLERLYGPLKALSEAEARRQFGERVTIVRPGFIVGPRDETDRFTYWPHRVAQGGQMLVPGDGADPVQFIDGRDLGEWMIRLAEADTPGTFNALGPAKPTTMDAVLRACEKATGAKPTYTHVAPELLEARQADLPIWVSRKGSLAGYGAVSNTRALRAGLTFRPLETTITDLLGWFRSQPAERRAKLPAGLTREQESDLLKAWRARSA
ncbi:NAD-dependent epimerase/dehydratase family protein [Dokdonella fugitiva]|uniref:NAD-dependent epimerase/dehydratase family protein n=1 Tax=Dokdonella fugitiva TaxID=328517 RepID=UPI0015FDEC5D|nr:NAD-dependent epimerase/dehydratase family protein [Dokdonella fugitiva]MBA8884410.1 2'-hydroxyisoflavone reductase [Dokdonella fugitiva]